MLAIFNSLNAHNFLIFQPILMILVSKFMVHRAFSDKAYLSLGLLSPLIDVFLQNVSVDLLSMRLLNAPSGLLVLEKSLSKLDGM